jgi:pyrroline-5-carboxylate reductase
MKDQAIAFIGAGNMARSLIGGLIATGSDAGKFWVSAPSSRSLSALRSRFAVHITNDNNVAACAADVLVLAVKPQVLAQVTTGLATTVQRTKPLVISLAAGVRESDVRRWLGGDVAVVRAMSNTPALVQTAATALYANSYVSCEQRDLAESILRAVGMTLWLDNEALMDPVTALSGSGPAYFFLVMELLEEAGVVLGLPRAQARLLTLQTAHGAAKLALEGNQEPAALRAAVTSAGGTTEKALEVLQTGGMRALIMQALQAATARAKELTERLGDSV